MCGIVALLSVAGRATDDGLVRRVAERLRHRGPDDAGVLVWDPTRGAAYTEDAGTRRQAVSIPEGVDAGVCLAVRRLAIIDRGDGGHQPMVHSTGAAVAFNGEIYNHVELRDALARRGHRFTTRSDTEVLLAAYAEWGAGCVHELVGMFAFVLVDPRRRRVLVARDPFGMKPLFFVRVPAGWLFASEIGAIVDAGCVKPVANPRVVVDYLETALTTRDGSETVFADVQQVPPGSYIERALGASEAPRAQRYWSAAPHETLEVSFAEATTLVREAFLDDVRLHLRSDVPVGVILSGGVDSSSVTMAMRAAGGDALDIHTFSYIGEDEAPSEERWIDAVNRAARTIPHKLRLRPEEWSGTPARAFHQGEPSGSLAVYAQNRLYREAGAVGAKVVTSGQGGDEVFAGYARHRVPRAASLLSAGRFGDAVNFSRRVDRARGSGEPNGMRVGLAALHRIAPESVRWGWARLSTLRGRRRLVDRAYIARRVGDGSTPPEHEEATTLRAELARGISQNLPTLLRYEDRSSMEHSVEGRLPFLTRRLVDLALALPDEYLVGPNGETKFVLKEAMRGLVPDEVLDRREKIGFAVPLRSWPARIPEMAGLLEAALDLPPVLGPENRDLVSKATGGVLSRSDAFAVWRLVGLADWARDFDVVFD